MKRSPRKVVSLGELDQPTFTLFCNDNQEAGDLEYYKEVLALDSKLTGLTGKVWDGEVTELWGTYDNRPWELRAPYKQLI